MTSLKRQKPRRILTADRTKRFGSSLMITGVNDSSKEDKFVSGSYKLVEGEHQPTTTKIRFSCIRTWQPNTAGKLGIRSN